MNTLCITPKLVEWAQGHEPARADDLAKEVAFAVHAYANESEVGYMNWLGDTYRVKVVEIQRVLTSRGTDVVTIKVQARDGEYPFYTGTSIEGIAVLSPGRIYDLGEPEMPADECDCNPLSGQVCGACRKILRRIEAEGEVTK
jgi:hypothetical protein